MGNVLLSVVIPTYNRYEYLKGCLEATTSIKSDELEIVVHDNTEDNSEILAVLESLHDNRIKYYHVKQHISVVENSESGVGYASGDYVCMIGDDDTICESMVQAARFCKENNVDACMAHIPGFNWPDMTFSGESEPNLFYTKKGDNSVREIEAYEVLKRIVKTAEGLSADVPRIYHGIVSKACLERVKSKCGSYFPGPSPDMANATAVSMESRRTIFISDYLMVSGYGFKSARGEGNRHAHYGKISEKPWLPQDTEKNWIGDIPKIFSGETIFAQSLLYALHRMDNDELAGQYNYGSLYAQFLSHHRDTLGYMLKFCLRRPHRIPWMIYGIFYRLRVRRKYMATEKNERYYLRQSNISTLIEAQKYTDELRLKLGLGHYYWE